MTMKYTREQINQAAANFLPEQTNGDLYDAYKKLIKRNESGDGYHLAMNYIDVVDGDTVSVENLIDKIEASITAKPIILIEIKDGILTNVISSHDINYLILDRDNLSQGIISNNDYYSPDQITSEEEIKEYFNKEQNSYLK